MELQPSVVQRPAWRRGEATVRDGWVVLDPARSELYPAGPEPRLLMDLVNVKRPSDAVTFVRRYGLLHRGPEASDPRERWEDWQMVVSTLEEALWMHQGLLRALAGDAEASRILEARYERARSQFPQVLGD